MTTTFVRQLFLPLAVRSVLPLRVAVHRVVPLPAWLVPAKRLSFLDALVSLFVHFIISVLDIGKFFGHMLLSEVKQQGGCGVVTECVLEIGNQIIPADNGFLLGGKVLDDAHLSSLVR